jgi:hypothetical protein
LQEEEEKKKNSMLAKLNGMVNESKKSVPRTSITAIRLLFQQSANCFPPEASTDH